MESLREEVIGNIRSCLISAKGKCDLRQLRSDYKMLMGCEIPFKKLNFVSLENLLCSIDSLVMTQGPGGQIFVDAKATEKTSHMVDLISKQKTTRKKPRIPSRPDKRLYMNRSPDTRWLPKNVSNKWRISYQNSPRPAVVSHNQFVNIPKEPKKAPLPPRFNRQLSANNNNNNNVGEVRDLRQLLNSKKAMSFESDSSSSSSCERLPHSSKTNRASLMYGIPRKHSPPVLSSNQVEIMKTVSLAAVDFQNPIWDSWTSSEESDVNKTAGLNEGTFKLTGNNRADLNNFMQFRKLGEPDYTVVQRKTKPHKPTLYDCKIKVETQTYSSYPNDFVSEEAAKEYTAKKALDDLMTKYGKRKSLLLSTEQDILERIPPIVEKHFHGIWNSQLEADYADRFGEQLPMNWLEIVDMSPTISVEAFVDKYVLRYCKPEDKGKKMFPGPVYDVSVPSSSINFASDGTLIAVVTCVVSAKEIWCRQIDTPESDTFNIMIVGLEKCYNHVKSFGEAIKSANIKIGGYYTAFFDGSWYRVRVFEVNENDVNCFFIDYGDEQWISKEHIYQLKREFAKEHSQAFICRLAGLEDLYEVSATSEHLQSLVSKTVHMENNSEENSKNDPISVVLYDIERGISINQELISLITLESASPILNRFGVTEVYISHVEENGDVYIQIHSPGYDKLESLLKELEMSLLENQIELPTGTAKPTDSKDRLYMKMYKENWRRLKIIDWSPCRHYAQIYFVDFGNCDVVKVANEVIYPLDEMSDVVNQFPEQAVKVRMLINSIPVNFVQEVNNLMPSDQPVLMKVDSVDAGGVSWVKFFKRIGSNQELLSINEAINFESEMSAMSKPEKLQRLISLNHFDDSALNKNVPSTGMLKSPALPQIGEYFDVTVPCAVNPWNFFVQPYESNDRLCNLMKSLQASYGSVTHSPLQVDDILPGKIYASKHEDGLWYRTSVIKVIHPGSISVFYCDFGYYANLTLQQLIALDDQFLDLPYQAIKAKLTGIKPIKQTKWTMDDCKYFQKLVCRKSFVSILEGIEKDELYRCDTILNLKLIDTSTDADIFIAQELVNKGIAVAVDN